MTNELNYTYGEAMFDVMRAENHMIRVVEFFPEAKSFHSGALCIDGSGNLSLNHLPQTGYHISAIDPDMLDEGTVVLIKGKLMAYEDAVFECDDLFVLDCIEGNVCHWSGTWHDRGYYAEFVPANSDGKTYRASNYGTEYVFLQRV